MQWLGLGTLIWLNMAWDNSVRFYDSLGKQVSPVWGQIPYSLNQTNSQQGVIKAFIPQLFIPLAQYVTLGFETLLEDLPHIGLINWADS